MMKKICNKVKFKVGMSKIKRQDSEFYKYLNSGEKMSMDDFIKNSHKLVEISNEASFSLKDLSDKKV